MKEEPKIRIDKRIKTVNDMGSTELNKICEEYEKEKLFKLAVKIANRITEIRLGFDKGKLPMPESGDILIDDLKLATNVVDRLCDDRLVDSAINQELKIKNNEKY